MLPLGRPVWQLLLNFEIPDETEVFRQLFQTAVDRDVPIEQLAKDILQEWVNAQQ